MNSTFLKNLPLNAVTIGVAIMFVVALQIGAFKLALEEFSGNAAQTVAATPEAMQGVHSSPSATASDVGDEGSASRQSTPAVNGTGHTSAVASHAESASTLSTPSMSGQVADQLVRSVTAQVGEHPYEVMSKSPQKPSAALGLIVDVQARSVSRVRKVEVAERVTAKTKAVVAKARVQPGQAKDAAVETKISKAPVSSSRKSVPANEAWLLSQPGNRFTLQLASFVKESGIGRFIRRHGLKGQLATFETDKKNLHWHVLTQGLFNDRASAIAASKSLTARTGLKVWIRPVRDVQAEIEARSVMTAMR